MEEQYGEAHRIWWLHLQDMSVQASKQALTCCLAGPDSLESNAIGTFTEILEQ